jgi:anti-anti-sigma regulatory factor
MPTDDVDELDLSELELPTGAAVAAMVDELRARAAAGRTVVLRGCPQLLAHTLYRTGLLRSGRLVLASWREEEPYG